jgi:hypothetical protein
VLDCSRSLFLVGFYTLGLFNQDVLQFHYTFFAGLLIRNLSV